MPDIERICDAFLSSYTDARELSAFKQTGINLTEFEDICFESNGLTYYYHFAGDDEKVLAHLETSKLMGEFIHYIKQRVDADINNVNITEKYKDYSRPKMLMISGHDSTLSSHEVFLIDALGLNFSHFRFPKFAAQMVFEVTRGTDGPKNNYSDYTVHYYFNDEEIYKIIFFQKSSLIFGQMNKLMIFADLMRMMKLILSLIKQIVILLILMITQIMLKKLIKHL